MQFIPLFSTINNNNQYISGSLAESVLLSVGLLAGLVVSLLPKRVLSYVYRALLYAGLFDVIIITFLYCLS